MSDFDILDQRFNHTISAVETNYVPNRDLGEHIEAALIGEDPAAALDTMEILEGSSIDVLELYTLPDNNYVRVTKSDVRLMAVHFGLIEEKK